MTRLLQLLMVMGIAGVVPLYGDTTNYTFHFQTQALGIPVPTGGFGYDSTTGVFSDFVVYLDGVKFDYTPVANAFGGKRRIPFEMGRLAQNLIDGYGPLGPELSHWYGGPGGFYGFEWRTPAQDFLYWDLTAGAPATPISSSPRAFAGTWSTTVTSVTATPEPATFRMLLVAGATAGALALRRRRARLYLSETIIEDSSSSKAEPSPR